MGGSVKHEWSVDDALDECDLHIECLRLVIKGIDLDKKKCDPDIRRTLYYCLNVVKDRRSNLLHVRSTLDSAGLLQ